jgi:hypothetical protein
MIKGSLNSIVVSMLYIALYEYFLNNEVISSDIYIVFNKVSKKIYIGYKNEIYSFYASYPPNAKTSFYMVPSKYISSAVDTIYKRLKC